MDDEIRGTTLRQLLRHQDNETVPSIELLRQAETAELCTLARDEKGGLVVTPTGEWETALVLREPPVKKKAPAKKKAAAKK